MAKVVKIGDLGSILEQRIQQRLLRLQPNDPRAVEVLTRIGMMIEGEAKLNIRRKRIIDTGTLLNSIRYRIIRQGSASVVQVGSFGVPYAAAHEFGFSGRVQVKSHSRSSAFGKPTRTYQVPSHSRWLHVRKRAYLKPAVEKKTTAILALLSAYYRGE
jgi:hypothetical protein